MTERRTGDHAAPSAPSSPAPRQGSEDIVGSPRPATTAGAVRARILLADDNADRRDYLRRLLCELTLPLDRDDPAPGAEQHPA